MLHTPSPLPELPRDLGGGLTLRLSCPADVEQLAAFNQRIHTEDDDPPDTAGRLEAWVRDLLSGHHPTHPVDGFTVVEDTASGRIVSCMNLIPQAWTYEGIPFGVGRPELVATEEAYRGRGLVRAQFAYQHALSAQRGDLVQAITGIPYYYRQFGYEMTVDLEGGRRGFAPQNVPALPAGESEPFNLRPACADDLAFIAGLYQQGGSRGVLACQRDEVLWRYNLEGESANSINRRQFCIIQTPQGQPIGYIAHPDLLWWNSALPCTQFEIIPGASWMQVTPVVIRYLAAEGQRLAARDGQTCAGFAFLLNAAHPALAAAGRALPQEVRPYNWFLRVPDLAAFILRIAPVLEKRLAASGCAGHSGEVKITFYRGGLRLVLENGRITAAENYLPPKWMHADAGFPPHTFLHILFGHRSLNDLRLMYIDCFANEKTTLLLGALFPKKPSDVWAVH